MTAPTKWIELSAEDQRLLESWLADFRQSWSEQRLSGRVQQLPPPGSPLRYPALLELVKIDLERQWQLGRRAVVEGYLKFYPELGSADTAPVELILKEYELRRQYGVPLQLNDFARRFPRQADLLRLMIEHAEAEKAHDPTQRNQGVESTEPTEANQRSPGGPGDLPEQFGRYRVVKKLGSGGMGSVYLGHDRQLDRPVALKIPHFSPSDGPSVLDRFYREARAAATINHPGICPVYDVGEHAGTHYMAMAYIEGRPLSHFVRTGKPLPQHKAAAVVRRLAQALQEAHERGVIHRDLKPSNIMINKRGEPILMDFGLARQFDKNDIRLTKPSAMMGTPAYMPPEQVAGDLTAIGRRSDIYSLGVILYELLTDRLPFEGPMTYLVVQVITNEPPPPSKFRPDLDRKLEAVCLKAMAKKSDDRYASMKDFAAALSEFTKSRSQTTGSPSDVPSIPLLPAAPAAVAEPPLPDEEPTNVLEVLPAEPYPNTDNVRTAEPAARGGLPTIPPTPPPEDELPPPPHAPFAQGRGRGGRADDHTPPPPSGKGGGPRSGRHLPAPPPSKPGSRSAKMRAVPPPPADATAILPPEASPARPGQSRGCMLRVAITLSLVVFVMTVGGIALSIWWFTPPMYHLEGQKAAKKGDYTKAIELYNKAIQANDKNPEIYLDRAEAHFKLCNYDETINDTTRALTLDKSSARGFCYRGGALGRSGQFEKGIADCDEAIRLLPNPSKEDERRIAGLAHAFRGMNYGNQSNFDQALKDLDRAIELDAKLALAYTYRAGLNGNRGNLAKAIYDCDEAIRLDPKLALAYAFRGVFKGKQGLHGPSIADFDTAIQLSPREAGVHNSRGVYYSGKGDWDLALTSFNKAIDLAPGFAEYYSNRAIAYLGKNDVDNAIKDTTEAIRLNSKSATAYRARGEAYYKQFKYDDALNDLGRAIQQNSKYADAYYLRGKIYADRSQRDLAIADFTEAINNNQYDSEAYRLRGVQYRLMLDYDKAVADFSRAIDIAPESYLAYIDRAIAYSYQKKYDEAIKDCDKALTWKLPDNLNNFNAYFWRGYARYGKAEYNLAIDDFDQALRFDNNSGASYYNRGLCHMYQKLYPQAIVDFEKAIKMNEFDGDAHFQLSKVYVAQGNLDKAREHYDKAVKLNAPSAVGQPRP